MKRWIALCFLFLIAFYTGATAFDPCEDRPAMEPPVCHILCSDGCATAPLPAAPVPPPPDPLPSPDYAAEPTSQLAQLDLEPLTTPPRTGIA